jgi:TatD DNase family protein
MSWIDTHCHLDAPEFDIDRDIMRQQAREVDVSLCVWPCVQASDFDRTRLLATQHLDAYALGIHPLYTPQAHVDDLHQLNRCLEQHLHDPRLVAIGEIGLDAFVPQLITPQAWEQQINFYRAQIQLARQYQLPVILHVRRSADALLKVLRETPVSGGIAHAFNGSLQQAHQFIDLGFKLGFGGAMTFDRAHQLQRLARELPLESLVLETDSPDMPPHWLYVTAEDRLQGAPQGRNTPAQLPRIAAFLAQLRGVDPDEITVALYNNTQQALPRLKCLL